MTGIRTRKGRRRASGFTLIELGIVVAVIAILASVVLFGRGFLMASRITKVSEAIDSIRKGSATYAGTIGGSFANAGTGNQLPVLGARGFIPVTTATWTATSGFTFNDLRFGRSSEDNVMAVSVTAPGVAQAEDIWRNATVDPTYTGGMTIGGTGGLTCQALGTAPTSPTVTVCFRL